MGFSSDVRIIVYEKYDGHCAYCGKDILFKDMQIDHAIPKYENGGDDVDNLMPSCRSCNHYKRAVDIEGFRRLLNGLHKRIADVYICKVGIDYGIIKPIKFSGKFYFETECAGYQPEGESEK
jgi:hypothetical protein